MRCRCWVPMLGEKESDGMDWTADDVELCAEFYVVYKFDRFPLYALPFIMSTIHVSVRRPDGAITEVHVSVDLEWRSREVKSES
jgi:hypothetical protein